MAEYILQLLEWDNIFVYLSWGVSKTQYVDYYGNKGLRMRVQGFKHKGWVMVLYNEASDYFDIILEDKTGKVNEFGKIKEKVTDVCFDELQDIVDSLVERTTNYEADVQKWDEENFASSL